MGSHDTNRRSFLIQAAALGLIPLTEPNARILDAQAVVQLRGDRPLKVVCVGAHPDDPESGCGGTLARYAELGHKVTIVYLTRGEAGISKKSHEEAGAIRAAEAELACRTLGAKAVFAGQTDGATEFNASWVAAMKKLLSEENPDVLFTHWPIDSHTDHQIASLLTMRAYFALHDRARLYFFEVDSGDQTMGFVPNVYVDITSTRVKKKAAVFAHRSQRPEEIYRDYHESMENFRGRELGVAAAEAFSSLVRDQLSAKLPGL